MSVVAFDLKVKPVEGLPNCTHFEISGRLDGPAMEQVNQSIVKVANESPIPINIVIDVSALVGFPSIGKSLALSQIVLGSEKIGFIVLIADNWFIEGVFIGIQAYNPNRFYHAQNMQDARNFLAQQH